MKLAKSKRKESESTKDRESAAAPQDDATEKQSSICLNDDQATIDASPTKEVKSNECGINKTLEQLVACMPQNPDVLAQQLQLLKDRVVNSLATGDSFKSMLENKFGFLLLKLKTNLLKAKSGAAITSSLSSLDVMISAVSESLLTTHFSTQAITTDSQKPQFCRLFECCPQANPLPVSLSLSHKIHKKLAHEASAQSLRIRISKPKCGWFVEQRVQIKVMKKLNKIIQNLSPPNPCLKLCSASAKCLHSMILENCTSLIMYKQTIVDLVKQSKCESPGILGRDLASPLELANCVKILLIK